MNSHRLRISVVIGVLLLTLSGCVSPSSSLPVDPPYPIDHGAVTSQPLTTSLASPEIPVVEPTKTPLPDFPKEVMLAHIAEREKVPPDQLEIISVINISSPVLNQKFWLVKVIDPVSQNSYGTLYDPISGEYFESIFDLERAESQVKYSRWGKLDEALFEHVQSMQPDETVPVAIWIPFNLGQVEQELYAALAEKYPEAKVSLEEYGNPFDVGELDLGNKLEREYGRLVAEQIKVHREPVEAFLQEKGVEFQALEEMPVLTAELTKTLIDELALRSDVAFIERTGAVMKPKENQLLDVESILNEPQKYIGRYVGVRGINEGAFVIPACSPYRRSPGFWSISSAGKSLKISEPINPTIFDIPYGGNITVWGTVRLFEGPVGCVAYTVNKQEVEPPVEQVLYLELDRVEIE